MEQKSKKQNENNDKNHKLVADALEKCRGRSKADVLKKASKLTADERLMIINHFEIEPQSLADTIILFWLRLERSTRTAEAMLSEPFFTPSG